MRFDKRKKQCFFQANNIQYLDFTDVKLLQKFVSGNGKILPRRITGVSALWQRRLSKAIKTARHACLMAPTQSF